MMYMFSRRTGEYTGKRPAQVLNGKELTISSSATVVPIPSDAPAGHVWVFDLVDEEQWTLTEDHRQHMDDKGTKQGGTQYWLPGDTHTSPARYMEKLGPLPADALLEQPAAPPPTEAELAATRKAEITVRLAEIDTASIRPLRAIADGTATDFDMQKLANLEAEAATLRDELAGMQVS
jgi:hypothetical protein